MRKSSNYLPLRVTFCSTAREERSRLGNYSTRWTKQSKYERSVVWASWEVVQSVGANMVFLRRKPTTTNTFALSPRKFSPPINFLQPPNRTTREKVVASPSDCARENRYFLADSGASLHMMSKKELISGEQETSEDQTRPPAVRQCRWKTRNCTLTTWTCLLQ